MNFILDDPHIKLERTGNISRSPTHHMNRNHVAHNLIVKAHLVRRFDVEPVVDGILVDATGNTCHGIVSDTIHHRQRH